MLLISTHPPLGVSLLLGESEEAAHGVRAGTEDEHKRSGVGHVLVEGGEFDRRTLHKLRTKVLSDKVNSCKYHLCVYVWCVICTCM